MSFYEMVFSPTGGTKQVADILSAEFSEERIFVDLSDASAALPAVSAEDVCLIAVPSFGGRVPACAAERIAAVRGNGAAAILVAVYGNRAYEDTLTELQDAALAGGFRPAAAVAAVAEHSVVRQFAAGRPDAEDAAELRRFADAIAERMSLGLPMMLSVPGNRPYKERGGSALRPAAEEGCLRCGACAAACPVGAISAETPELPANDSCIACMRCISVCPHHVRGISEAVLGKIAERLAPVCSERKGNELFL